ncbi:MAG: iron ABC transporter permease [Lachnospiraceae bacterium]|jgi:iron complex transport system permease protein|nr:iron ABC transporter permease [Lachnospiraceae bacterium]GFI19123.1 putative ABC transporter permease protein [Lachnospiraceae bacterium]
MDKNIRVKKYLLSAFLLILAGTVLSLFTGKYPLASALLGGEDPQAVKVLLTLRLPRTCMALLGGFGLGTAGYVYQMVFHNPLASPDIIGVSSGASAGAAFGILFLSAGAFPVTAASFLGGLTAVALTLALTRLAPGTGQGTIVLAGIAVHSLAQTLLMILKLTADPERELASIEYWIMGSLNAVSLYRLPFTAVLCLFCLAGIFLLRRQILLLSVDQEESRMLGVAVEKIRFLVLLLATLLTAAIISLTGLISFIGLIAPHTARLLTKDNSFPTLFLGGLLGSFLLLSADLLARSVTAGELPVSIFTSLLGVPFLLYLMLKRN